MAKFAAHNKKHMPMFKRSVFWVAAAILSSSAFGQASNNYYYIQLYSYPEGLLQALGSGQYTTLMQAPADDTWGTPVALGFSFPFYGQTYDTVWVSDNGYLVFDTTNNVSTGNNTAIPSAAAPNGAVYGFWDNLQMSTASNPNFPDHIRAYSWGTAPNRAYTFYWYSVTLNNDGFCYVLITLYEDGKIDIIIRRVATQSSSFGGTVGIESPDGQHGLMVAGPNYTHDVDLKAYQDVLMYRIIPGVQPKYDVYMGALLPSHAYKGKKTPLEGYVYNLGSETITSLEIRYSAGISNVGHVFNVNIPPNGQYEFSFPKSKRWTPISAPANVQFTLYVDKINNHPDTFPDNNSVSRTIYVGNGTSAPRNVVIEEFTGAWCGFCPDGALKVEEILQSHPEVVAISRHVGDDMALPQDDSLNAYYRPFFPQALIDRFYFSIFDGSIPKDRSSQSSPNLWEEYVASRKGNAYPSSIDLSMTSSYDTTTRQLTVTVKGNFVDYDSGDIRVHFLLLQDSVTGSGDGYDQVNYYSSQSFAVGGASHPFYNLPDPIVGYRHNHTIRVHATPLWGAPLSASPRKYTPNDSFERTWTITLPSTIDDRYAYPVAFVSYYEGTEVLYYNYVINGTKQGYLNPEESVGSGIGEEPTPASSGIIRVAPNPASEWSLLYFQQAERLADVTVRILDVTGKEVATVVNGRFVDGKHPVMLPVQALRPGMYIVAVTINGVTYTERLHVVK